MKIGLIDADLMFRKDAVSRRYGKSAAAIFPNLALMKISAHHKALGDEVEWYNALEEYDKVYVSKIFSNTPNEDTRINAREIIYGGSGYCIYLGTDGKEHWQEPSGPFRQGFFQKNLPYDIEHIMPDYSLYPTFKDTAIGFLSRGCPRGCFFCHVKAKEGRSAYKVADLSEWWNGQKNIFLCDPNILACKDWRDLLQQLIDSKAHVDINQGLDARLLTPEKVKLICQIKIKAIHFAWDDYKQKDKVLKGLQCFAENCKNKISTYHAQVYCLVNFDTTHEQDLERVYTLRDMGFEPYIMVYDKEHADPFYKSLQRWVNMRAIFNTIKTFDEYDKTKAKE